MNLLNKIRNIYLEKNISVINIIIYFKILISNCFIKNINYLIVKIY